MAYLTLVETEFFGKPWVHAAVSEQLIIALPITQDGRFITISQSRPAFEKRVLSAVMGTFHETDHKKLLRTVAREVKSETGHFCKNVRYMMTVARSSGLTDETGHVYLAVAENDFVAQELHAEEDIEVMYMTRQQIQDAIIKQKYVIDSSLPYYLLINDKDLMF